ncbi:dsDNA nuclease domain-containing protein [Acinetobacter modestus]|uniref:dsDNA nuclease domain-containing protein n=1 Tax=Acinetobacter modestus TaxID=1776740 RepID=UPI003017B32C
MSENPTLHTVKPREQNGRDSFSRYKAQIRSAAIASLSILEGKDIDRIYCDFHDDFVVRKHNDDGVRYIFFQVKTKDKQNKNWAINDIIGINPKKSADKQDANKIKDSFIGKLLLHTINFDDICQSVVFQTNINNSDDAEDFFYDLKKNNFENKFIKILIEKFNEIFKEEINEIFDIDSIKEKLKKLESDTDVEYLKKNKDSFEPLVRSRIYKFSEIDLNHDECKQIIIKLLDLVEVKSSGVIAEITKESIEEFAGISITDLLEILSITYGAYQILLAGGDESAIKNASIIQRALSASGASNETIEYCSRCKSEWDLWLRKARHNVSEFDLEMILSEIREILKHSVNYGSYLDFKMLKKPIKDFYKNIITEGNIYGLNENFILGGVISEYVRVNS